MSNSSQCSKAVQSFPILNIKIFPIFFRSNQYITYLQSTMASKLNCNKCNYQTSLPNQLYSHTISVHGYTCPQCDFTVIFKRDLQRHIISIHQEKNLICTQCNYVATNNNEIKLHFKEQHSKINYQCLHCNYHTHWRTNLYKHVKKYHSINGKK